MPGIKAEVVGQKTLERRLRAIGRQIESEVRQAIVVSAVKVEGDAKRSIERNPRRGRPYVRYDPLRTGRASAPGDAPADDLGVLARNITHVVDGDGLGASVESRAAYSLDLEFGTSDMAARPFMQPAFEKHKAGIKMRVANSMRAALGRRIAAA